MVTTISVGGAASIGVVAANFQIGIAINDRGDMMGFVQGGPSVGVGVTAGLQVVAQRGSLNDLLKPTGEGGGGNLLQVRTS